jgi:hypothetical protein
MINNSPTQSFFNIKSSDLLKDTEYEGYSKKKVLEAEVFKGMEKYFD